MTETTDEKSIEVETSRPGYAHTTFEGRYSGPVTKVDIEAKFKSPFGGRWNRFGNGRFSYVRHDD